jgi:hypothetical protein
VAESSIQGINVVADNQFYTWNDIFEMLRGFYPRLSVFHVLKSLALLATVECR